MCAGEMNIAIVIICVYVCVCVCVCPLMHGYFAPCTRVNAKHEKPRDRQERLLMHANEIVGT